MRLKQLREAKGWSQATLADKLGVPESTSRGSRAATMTRHSARTHLSREGEEVGGVSYVLTRNDGERFRFGHCAWTFTDLIEQRPLR